MTEWTLIGVPTSAGAHHAGQEQAPAALRKAGLVERLLAAGVSLADAGDLPVTEFAVDRAHPAARNLTAVVEVARAVADTVAGIVSGGGKPLVVGGDCTITLGVIAGFRRQFPGVGLAYVDGDADLSAATPGDSGILDSTGIAHLLGLGALELASLDGEPPLLTPDRLALLGVDPREVSSDRRTYLDDAGVSYADAAELSADPEGTARRALTALTGTEAAVGQPLVVHFDVDVVDSGDLPLGNFPHYGSGVLLEHAVRGLRVLLADPSCAGLVLTEVNPTHDADGSLLDLYTAGLAAAFAA
jgi:arginase